MIVHTLPFITAFRGKIGNIVFRKVRGKIIASKSPVIPASRKGSAVQQYNRGKFKAAAIYAKCMMLDPAKKEYYRQKARKLNLPNAYTAALTDYMRKTRITDVNVKPSNQGTDISFRAYKDSFDINSMTAQFYDRKTNTPLGDVLAVSKVRGGYWRLSASEIPSGCDLMVSVKGNPARLEQVWVWAAMLRHEVPQKKAS